VNTPTGPTDFENNVFCRVRNVGAQAAENVLVQFFYAKFGTGVTTWIPVTDKSGTIQTLNLGRLAAGATNFPDSAQNLVPTRFAVKWYIPPLATGETVDHFRLKAVVSSSNDVSPHNNEVESNIACAPYTPGAGFRIAFMATNPMQETIPLDLRVQATLPQGWQADVPERQEKVRLEPGEERLVHLILHMAPGADKQLLLPFDGEVWGEMFGSLTGQFTGTLTETTWDGEQLRGQLAADLDNLGTLLGGLEGSLNVHTGAIRAKVDGMFHAAGKAGSQRVVVGVTGSLRPLRRVDITQFVEGQPIGGVTVQVQVPPLSAACEDELPPHGHARRAVMASHTNVGLSAFCPADRLAHRKLVCDVQSKIKGRPQ
jgi:hypothetical protein